MNIIILYLIACHQYMLNILLTGAYVKQRLNIFVVTILLVYAYSNISLLYFCMVYTYS